MDGRKAASWYGNSGETQSSTESSSGTGKTENGGTVGVWDSIIDKFVDQMEMVSSHFGYTEEYVLEHTVDWLQRKHKQSIKEQWERSRERVVEGFKSISLVLDGVFNKGKGMDDLLPSSFEEAIEQSKETQKEASKFVSGQWWQKSG